MSSIKRTMRATCIALALAGALPACAPDGLLTVANPDIIDPEDLLNVTGAAATHAGALSELTAHVSGSLGGGLALFDGMFTDQLMYAGNVLTNRTFDLRDVPVFAVASATEGLFLAIQRARYRNDRAARVLADVLGASDKRVGEVLAFAGWSYIYMAEFFCSGVPVSDLESRTLGAPLTTTQLLDTALVRLTAAVASTENDARIVNLIRVLRGRALLNRGDFAAAAQAVADVPTGYTYQFFHSANTTRQQNALYAPFVAEQYSVSDREGTNGLDYGSANDPRVPTLPGSQASGLSRVDQATPMRIYARYASNADPFIAASGIEARLIEAEAALRAGDVAAWLSTLNAARATRTGLAPLGDPGTEAGRVDLMFRERAFWLFLTAHRTGDLRRLVRQYGRAPESVFPTGAYHKLGLTRGSQVSWVVPVSEEANPNFDRAACNPTRA
jgi:hypothetical protein